MRINIRTIFDEEPKKLKQIVGDENPEEASGQEPELEAEPDTEPEEAEPESEPELEVDPDPEPHPEEEPDTEPEPEEANPEPEPEPALCKTKVKGLWHKYGSLVAIAAAFAVLIAFMFVYTTMIPREVHAVVDGEKQSVITREYTVEGFLEEQKIAYCEEDSLSTPPEGFIHDGMKLRIVHAADFKVVADGKTMRCKSLEKTVGEALEDAGIKVRKRDIVTPERNSPLTRDMKITVQRVEFKKTTVKEKVPFSVINQHDTTMNQGESKIVTKGKNGRDKVTYEITYIDGKEASRKELSREELKPVVDEVVANGTRIVYNGKSYSRKLVVKAYSYTGGGTTAMGTRARVGEIAVDPRIIPLGTNVYIEGIGARRAEDTGGNIKGNTIDIYMNTHAECIRWGVRYVTIYIE